MGRLLRSFAILCASALAGCASPGLTTDPEPPKTALQIEAEKFCAARRQDDTLPPKRFTTDGCSIWPDSTWGECCVSHDMEYWCGGSFRQRSAADKKLGECVADDGHPVIGTLMHIGTRLGGGTLWPAPWRWGYGWYWPTSGKLKQSGGSAGGAGGNAGRAP